ncbi:MAG: SMP-30/gluconolactonase/LRE family protein [Gammaproteobacteria bacterium]|nr:SMP-30/gluconolactonase/LRE family protein [Gammaproteobacteria bacterium]
MADQSLWKCLWKSGTMLGESPLWCAETNSLLFVDIKHPGILSWHPGGRTAHYRMPTDIGCIVHRQSGGLVAALRTGIAFVTLDPLVIELVLPLETDLHGNRFNDGKCDSQGQLWLASMDDAVCDPSGAIWRISANLSAARMGGGYVVGNGFGWSPDNSIMYFTDSENRTIFSFPFDSASGSLGERCVFATVPDDAGYPDGLTVDCNGYVWSVHWDGARITRYRPDGSVDRVIAAPVPRPTSLAFGGKDLDRLFVTSALIGLDKKELARAPLSGSLFEVDTAGVRGRVEPRFIDDGGWT